MHRIKRPLLIFLMLCGLSGVFVTTFIMAGTASAVSRSGPNPTCDSMGDCCSGEFCCWAQGQTPPTCASASSSGQSVTSTSQEEEYKQGYDAGKEAGKAGTPNACPRDRPSDYCNGWDRGYQEGQRQRQQGSGISLFGIIIPTPVLIGIGIVIGVGIFILGGGAIAGAGPGAAILARFRR